MFSRQDSFFKKSYYNSPNESSFDVLSAKKKFGDLGGTEVCQIWV